MVVEQEPRRIPINIRNDYIFKRIFAFPGHERLLVMLINAILGSRLPQPIVSLVVKNPLYERTNPSDKQVIYDIRAQDDQGREYIIEMQNRGGTRFVNRFLFYTAGALVAQLTPGHHYNELRPTYGIAIVDFYVHPEIVQPVVHMYLSVEGHDIIMSDLLNLSCLQLPALRITMEECITDLDRICYTFSNNIDLQTRNPEDFPKGYLTEETQMILDTLKTIDRDPEERAAYEADLKYQRDLAMIKLDGREEGLAQGIEIGTAQGKLEGRIEGKLEGKRNLLLRVLTVRFGEQVKLVAEKIAAIGDENRIDELADLAVECQSIQEFSSELLKKS